MNHFSWMILFKILLDNTFTILQAKATELTERMVNMKNSVSHH